MRKDKEKAGEMRREGKSYNEIRQELKIPLGTLSEWFSGKEWSQNIRKKLTDAAQIHHTVRIRELDAIRGKHLQNIYEEARGEARQDFEVLQYNPLFIAGVMLYWGEGDKVTKYNTRLTNTDPNMVRLFVIFLQKVCRIPADKIRGNILIYPDLEPQTCIQYWSEKVGLPSSAFSKCVNIQGRHKTKRLSHGICIVVVSSTYFKVKMLEWMKLLPQQLMNREYYVNITPTRD